MSGLLKNRNFVSKGVANFTGGTGQASVGSGTTLNAFQIATFNSSTSIVRTSDTVVTLAAGRTYKISAAFYTDTYNAATSWIVLKTYNNTAGAYFGSASLSVSATDTLSESTQPSFVAYITTTVATSISIKGAAGGGTVSVSFANSYVSIEEVEAYMQLNPLTAGQEIVQATEKTTPVDADMVGLMDSAAGNILKKLSWANVKATLKTYFDTLYLPVVAPSVVGPTSSPVYTTVSAEDKVTGTAITLTTGTWIVTGRVYIGVATSVTWTRFFACLRDLTGGINYDSSIFLPSTGASDIAFGLAPAIITVSSGTKAIGVNHIISFSAGSMTTNGSYCSLKAVKIPGT